MGVLIARIEALAPDDAQGLKGLVDDFQFWRMREMLQKSGWKMKHRTSNAQHPTSKWRSQLRMGLASLEVRSWMLNVEC